jgi:aminoglycoside phosphotransferase (APT) family kinase protein
MCATGDPLIDLGILLCYWSQADDSMARQSAVSSPTALPGWMTRTEIIERYARRTGRDVSAVAFYETFAIFKLAVVVQQIYFRWHQGQTQDKRFARFDRVVEGLAEAAYNLTRGSDIGLWCFNEAGRLRDQV